MESLLIISQSLILASSKLILQSMSTSLLKELKNACKCGIISIYNT